jgi:hypothetical protein
MPSFVKIDTGVQVIWRGFLRNLIGFIVGIYDWRDLWSKPLRWAVVPWYMYRVSWRLVQTLKRFWMGGYTYRHEDTQTAGWFHKPLLFFKKQEIRLIKVKERVRTKELHILSHIRLILTTLPWKRNRLLLGRPLLVDELEATVRSIWSLKPVSGKWTFHLRAPLASIATSLKFPHMQLYLGISPHKLLKSNQNC